MQRLRGHRYRFDAVILELRTADSAVYQTVLLAFINCLVMANEGLAERTRTRSELMGSGLGQLLDTGRQLFDVSLVFAMIIAILVVGVAVDRILFSPVERGVLRRRGLLVD